MLRFELICLTGIAVVSAIGEALWGIAIPLLLAGIVAYCGWHLYHLFRLSDAIRTGKQLPAAFPAGLWGVVYKNAYILKKRSRKRKRRLSRFLRRFTESASAFPDAAVILGQGKKVEWCNPAAGELLGISWPQDAGQTFSQIVADPILQEFLEVENEKALEFTSPVDQRKILSVYVTPFGKKHQQLLIARDVTASYYVDRMRRDFVANASHELRTPLTVIRGFLEVWKTQNDSPQRLRSTELMLSQARRMEETIQDLLTLSRMEHDGLPAEEAAVDVPGLLDSIVKEAMALAENSDHAISLVLEDNRHLHGNAAELRDAFSNLVFNAVRHTPPHTVIQVKWTAHGNGAQLTVADNGGGIPRRHIPRLTERFYRVDSARSRESGGTGLGLAIVKHVLARHDAELEISSEVGAGSTFTCMFAPQRLIEPVDKDTVVSQQSAMQRKQSL